MSKISPLGQSMAALFSPESEKVRSKQKESSSAPTQGQKLFSVPGAKALSESSKSQDSLGNPSGGLGYEPFRKEKSQENESNNSPKQLSPNQPVLETPELGSHFIRLNFGWEKVLLAQKKICEKAKNLFTALEAPGKYLGQRKSSSLVLKSRGSILDLDVQQIANEKQAQEKLDKLEKLEKPERFDKKAG